VATPPASIAEFKDRMDRDFIFGTTTDKVRDKDITNALTQASSVFNEDLWTTEEVKEAFIMAASHFVELNMRAAGGLSAHNMGRAVNSTGDGVIQNKSVGGVSIGYAIPDRVMNSPTLSPFMKTNHGQIYLQMLAPRLVGNMVVMRGPNDTGGSPSLYIPPVPPPDDI
jgi:hypothetical protein